MKKRSIKRRWQNVQTGEEGIALIITLSILAVILLMAVGFALTARTELKSSSSYSDMVAAESLAKMAMDRCLMEIAYQPPHQPFSGNTNNFNYTTNDVTQMDGSWNNDFSQYFSLTAQADFVNRDSSQLRSSSEPYWISVTNRNGRMIGRFAYVSSGVLVDINAIGNIFGAGDLFVRGDGSIGNARTAPDACGGTNTYTRGICSDVSLEAFLDRLGYGAPFYDSTESARRILCFRYGWPAKSLTPPVRDWWRPGDANFDEDGDGVFDNPQEYDPVQPVGCLAFLQIDQAVPSLDSLDDLPPGLYIAPDHAKTNLQDYATTYSSESNLTNSFGIARLSINAMTSSSDVPAVVNMLSQAATASLSNNLLQVALNLIDFHTTNLYPTVYQTGGKTFVGIKPTPYLNQVLALGRIRVFLSHTDLVSGEQFGRVELLPITGVEVWNPYPNQFPDPCHNSVINTYSVIVSNIPSLTIAANFASPFTFNAPLPGFTAQSNTNGTLLTAEFPADTITWPLKVSVTNALIWTDFYGFDPTNLINTAGSANTNMTVSFPGLDTTNWVVFNLEADDPRINVLYNQPTDFPVGSGTYSLGTNNPASNPTLGTREGIGSFYVKTNDYVTIGEIGYVHRGDPWTTIRLQPNPPQEPIGDGSILDYIRVTDLLEVRGRININADTNGPLGTLESPALFALFSGLTNSSFQLIEDFFAPPPGKIESIVQQIGDRRAAQGDFTSIGQLCGITELTEDFAGGTFQPYEDAERESILRRVSNLITTRADSGTTEIIAWGQVIKGKPGNYVTGPVVQIRAKYINDWAGHLVRITKFQYTRQ